MKDSLTQFNYQDFHQRYRNSYGFLHNDDGTKRLVWIRGVDGEQVKFQTSNKGIEYFAKADANVIFEFLPVQRSWYDLTTHAGLLYRIPAKQYCRGISSNNTAYYMTGALGLTKSALTFDVLEQVFVLKKPENNVNDFLSGIKNFFVLSRTFCIAFGKLYFFNEIIGECLDRKTLCLSTPIVKQELADVIKRNNYPFVIKVDHDNR